jgi:hypothetical protein
MSDSLHIADQLFSDAETLVERIEHACRVASDEQGVYEQITSELLPVAGAAKAMLWVRDQERMRTLSCSGSGPAMETEIPIPESAAKAPSSSFPSTRFAPRAEWTDHCNLATIEQLSARTAIGLNLQFDHAAEASLSRPLCELCETVLGLASAFYLRHRFATLTDAAEDRLQRDQLLDQINAGCNLTESLACVAGAVAAETLVDRVAILRMKAKSAQLLVSSTQPRVDRRARQVRLLETLVARVLSRSDRFRYVVGNPDLSNSSSFDPLGISALDQYLNESGCRDLYMEAVFDQPGDATQGECVAAIVLERFRVADSPGLDSIQRFEQLRLPAFAAIWRALERNRFGWSVIAQQLLQLGRSRRFITLIAAVFAIALALTLIPAEFAIPVEGRLLTAKHHRLYAPATGTVTELNVTNGQAVNQGQPLLQLRSATLDQQQRQLEGALATAKSKLAVVTASRSRSEVQRGATPNSVASSDEQVLKTEVDGLQSQLDLVNRQQLELTLLSPINGRVDRWDLQQSLTGRPVVHGQFLVDIFSDVDGWMVELDVPDAESQYVAAEQSAGPCEVTFRLRSSPEKLYRGTLEQLSAVTQFDASGQPVVHAAFHIDATDPDLRFGATVIAQIHCGTRPLGFVWFRSVIEWAGQLDWL